MKSFTLDWKGWWLLRTPMSDVPELAAKTCIYAVMGAKLKKVGAGVGSSGREPILFNIYKGAEPVREHLQKLLNMSLGVFAAKRAKEIKKHAIVYVAAVPDDTDLGDLASLLSLVYGAVPFAPKHHAMPAPYDGETFHIKNDGRNPGLPAEIFHTDKSAKGDSDKTHDPDATHDGAADAAMSAAIAAEAQATRRLTQSEMDARGIATEKVAKPNEHLATEKLQKPPRLVETAKVDKDGIEQGMATERVPKLIETTKVDKDKLEQGLATERVPKPPAADGDDQNTEFVPKPEKETSEEPTILDEAGKEAS
ncbi:MAG: hypothetical protein H6839_11200 [Planctomycetes bacterium]|nr:hypothetical protein [Planctomycetota bacterium]